GLVKITRNGHGDALKFEIDPSITSGMSEDDREMLVDLVLAAINDSQRKIQATSQDSMSALGSGLDLGSLGDIGKLFK
ncbi:MAG: YbaB/EbfC family nucleoid-associated protein, partial [Gammaproteobacteria bacterium]|nr:YbaB/EbfC family nucleoid-associated protein [Gammaproteobacteria bacterium]